MFRYLSGAFGLLVSVACYVSAIADGEVKYEEDSLVINECGHLKTDGDQYNWYETENGNKCCMCDVGTYVAYDCSAADPNTTVCEPCAHTPTNPTYMDYGPHNNKKCFRDKTNCQRPQIRVGGSPSSQSRCECPTGYKKRVSLLSYLLICDPVISPTTTISSASAKVIATSPAKQVTTANMQTTKIITHGAEPTTQNYHSTISKDTRSNYSNNTDKIKDSIFAQGVSDGNETSSQNEIGNGSSIQYVHAWILRSFVTSLLLGVIVLIYHLWKRCWPKKTHKETDIELQKVSYEANKDENYSDKGGTIDGYKPLLPDSKSDQVIVVHEQQESNSMAAPSSSENMNPELQFPEINTKYEISFPNIRPSYTPGIASTGKMSKHDAMRRKAFNEMAAEISKNDICVVGRNLLPQKRNVFEDVYYDQTYPDRREKAHAVFDRAIQMKPSLTLEDILNAVQGLGYLEDIVEDCIKECADTVD